MIALDATRFALAHDATPTRVSDLPQPLRLASESEWSDVIWTQTRSRMPSFVVGADAADLLRGFHQPVGVAEAVFQYCTARMLDPKQVLRDAYPLLREAVDRGLLVAENAWAASRPEPSLRVGDAVDQWTVSRCIQSLTDSEVYEAHNDASAKAVLKVARSEDAAERQRREARFLEILYGAVGPRLLGRGAIGASRYIAIEWREGQAPTVIAEQLRADPHESRPRLVHLARAVIHAYHALHQRGFVHGDVHPLNLVVDRSVTVSLLDFEAACQVGLPNEGRGYVPYYLDPEMARALRDHRPLPASAPESEQFALGALLFELFTGERYLNFHLETERFLRQVCQDPPRSFAECGVRPWPAVERVLARALAKEPGRRFQSLEAFGAALEGLGDTPARRSSAVPQRRWLSRQLRNVAADPDTIRRAQDQPPRSSLYYGVAGTALLHLRLADLRGDADHLASADCWCARAEYLTSDADAYSSPSIRESGADVSGASLLHGPPGVALTRAMIGNARGDDAEVDRACRWFLRSASSTCANRDLTLGRSGVLFSAARFLRIEGLGTRERERVRSLGRRLVHSLVAWAEKVGGPANQARWRNLGLAHGWAGVLFSMLRWCEVDPGTPLPSRMVEWLDALGGHGERNGRCLRWPWLHDGRGPVQMIGYASGWCNGSAGFVLLWGAAHRALGRPLDLHRMEAAAMDSWLTDNSAWSLCCGTTGRALSLLVAARVTGEERWVSRAKVLAARAMRQSEADLDREHRHSLFRGDAGVVLLLAELEQPDIATFPVYETHP